MASLRSAKYVSSRLNWRLRARYVTRFCRRSMAMACSRNSSKVMRSPPTMRQRLEPENLNQMCDCVKLWITSNDDCLRAQGSTDRKSIGIRERKLRFHPGGFEDIGEGIGHRLDRERAEAMEEVLSLLQGAH